MHKKFVIYLFLFVAPFVVAGQNVAVFQGKVIDNNSVPVQGITVNLLNTNYSSITNKYGVFMFENISSGAYVLNISGVGYAEINRQYEINAASKETTIVLQHTYQQLDELTVTAQKREEPIQELPLSITALSARQIEHWRLWNINDLSAISPNLFVADPGDRRNVTSIRGIVTTSYDPAVATYIDGVNQFGLDSYISTLYDVERIEILRGPQGTLYGRNAMGGVINIITKKPENKTTAFAEASIGNYHSQRFTAGVKTALIKDKLYVGVAGMHEGTDGFYHNEFNNRSYDKQHSVSGNYYVNYLLNKKWRLSINFKHIANRNSGPFPLVTDAEKALKNPYKLSQNAVSKMVDNTANASATLSYSGHNFNFTSQTSYQSNYRFYRDPLDADFSSLDAITIVNNYGPKWNKVKVLTQEFKLSSSARSDTRLSWVTGTYLFYQNSPVKQTTHFGEDALMAGMPDNNFSLINTSTSKAFGLSIYGQATYKVTSKLDIIAGLRYDYEHKKLSILGEYQKDPDPIPLYTFQSDTSATARFSALSPKIGIAYHLTENNHAFFTYSKGFRAGGLTPISSDPSQPPLFKYKQEQSSSVEAGFKNSFLNKRMIINISFFLTNVKEVQVPTLILPEGFTVIKNTGELRSKGMEMEMTALVAKGLQIDYNFGYTNATYKSFKTSENNTEINLAGNKQIFTPDITSMLAIQYNILVGKGSSQIFARSEWRYLGNQYFDIANTIQQTPYNIFNGTIGLKLKKNSISLWARNLTDKKYILYAYDFGAVHLGSPFIFGSTLSVKL